MIVASVRSRGKHLLIELDDGLVVRTHLRMSGSWHIYRHGERWTRPRHQLRCLIGVAGWDAVCFAAPDVVVSRQPDLSRVGPDLCDEIDIDVVVDRFRRLVPGSCEIADALLDQRVASSIGNVYKSEVLHACACSPFVTADEVDDEMVTELYSTVHRLLVANLDGGPRATVPGGLAVYKRAGQPCRDCGRPVRRVAQGPNRRATYWCEGCQVGPRAPGEGH